MSETITPGGFVHRCAACGEQWIRTHQCKIDPSSSVQSFSGGVTFPDPRIASLESRIQRLDAMLRDAAALIRDARVFHWDHAAGLAWIDRRDALLAEIAKEQAR